MFPLRAQGVKMKRIYGKYSAWIVMTNFGGKGIITRKREPKIGSVLQAWRWNAITT
jgi:hypothetical protein